MKKAIETVDKIVEDAINSVFLDSVVPEYVQRAFIKVQKSGKVNMFYHNSVLKAMNENKDSEAVSWLADWERSTDFVEVDKDRYVFLLKCIDNAYKNHLPITMEKFMDESVRDDIISLVNTYDGSMTTVKPDFIQAILKLFQNNDIDIDGDSVVLSNDKIMGVDEFSGQPYATQKVLLIPFSISISGCCKYCSDGWNYEFALCG